MLRGSSILVLLLVLGAGVDFFACETIEASGNVTAASPTKRIRFTRRQTTPTTTSAPVNVDGVDESVKSGPIEGSSNIIAALNVSTDAKPSNDDVVDSVESSLVTGSPNISIDIVTKKSLHVRNCGERIGDDVPFIATLIHTNPLYKSTSKRKRSLSKGVLISENFVLATVSSIYHSESFWTVSSVRLGDFVTWNKYANRDKSHTVEIAVEEIFFHKKKDLALIKLKESVAFTDVIRPACLPSSDYYNFKELQSHLCKRSHNNRAPADVTLEFAAPLSTFDCKQFFARKQMTISQQEFCVWDESGDDCTGDIGSPLFTTHNGRLSVIGLRSYAESDEEFIDPSEYPAVYVKIGAFLDWISAVLNLDENKEKKP